VVFAEADDGESAGVVWGLRRADIEEASAVWKFDYVIDMRGDADVFVEVLLGVICGDARAGFDCMRGEARAGEQDGEPEDWAQGHWMDASAFWRGWMCGGSRWSDFFELVP
jgi:hypothetical protein